MVEAFAELTLEARDLELLERFYCEAFGCRVISREDERVWLAVGEHARLGIWTPGVKEFGDEGGRHVHFAFSAPPAGSTRCLSAERAFRRQGAGGASWRRSVDLRGGPGGERRGGVGSFRRAEGAHEGWMRCGDPSLLTLRVRAAAGSGSRRRYFGEDSMLRRVQRERVIALSGPGRF